MFQEKKSLKDLPFQSCFRFNQNGSVYFVSKQLPSISKTIVRMVNDGSTDTRKSDTLVYPVDPETL